MSAKQSCAVDLQPSMVAFLEEMVKTYQLPDVGKAVRCLLNFAREKPELHQAIFQQIRCADC